MSWSPELVAVCVLFVHIHEVIQCDQVGLVVDIQHRGLNVIDVVAVVINVLRRSLSISQDVIIVPDNR